MVRQGNLTFSPLALSSAGHVLSGWYCGGLHDTEKESILIAAKTVTQFGEAKQSVRDVKRKNDEPTLYS
jgi:hypothetical protein